jgi:hypothetical protein
VSTGYSDRPVARAIKIKHAGLNLTGRWVQLMTFNCLEKTRLDLSNKLQASSLTAGPGYDRIDLERNNYG